MRSRMIYSHCLVFIKEPSPLSILGVPLSINKLTIQECLPLVEKITTKLKCSSARLLSYFGGLPLIKYVLFGMQSYWAQNFVLPKKVVKIIEAACRTFLWTGKGEMLRKALAAWEKACKLGAARGLIINAPGTWKKTTIPKQLWVISMKKESLWIKWINYDYIKSRDLEIMDNPKNASWVIRKIIDNRKVMIDLTSVVGVLIQEMKKLKKQGKFKLRQLITICGSNNLEFLRRA